MILCFHALETSFRWNALMFIFGSALWGKRCQAPLLTKPLLSLSLLCNIILKNNVRGYVYMGEVK